MDTSYKRQDSFHELFHILKTWLAELNTNRNKYNLQLKMLLLYFKHNSKELVDKWYLSMIERLILYAAGHASLR